jgi:hypothetical protein
VIGLYDPTTNIDRALAALPPDLKKFVSGLDYRPLQIPSDQEAMPAAGETPAGAGTGTTGAEAEHEGGEQEQQAGAGAGEGDNGTPLALEVSVGSPAGSRRSPQEPFTPGGQVETQTISWILRAAGLRVR